MINVLFAAGEDRWMCFRLPLLKALFAGRH